MSVWGMWKLEVILEIAVSMEGWAPAGLQQALASSPTPTMPGFNSLFTTSWGSQGGFRAVGGGVGSGEAWDSHYLLISIEVSQCFNCPCALTLDVPAG